MVARAESSVLNQHGSNGTFALVKPRFYYYAARLFFGVSQKLFHIRHKQKAFQKIVYARARFARNGANDGFAAVVFGKNFVAH